MAGGHADKSAIHFQHKCCAALHCPFWIQRAVVPVKWPGDFQRERRDHVTDLALRVGQFEGRFYVCHWLHQIAPGSSSLQCQRARSASNRCIPRVSVSPKLAPGSKAAQNDPDDLV
jgi:hypothetical protein